MICSIIFIASPGNIPGILPVNPFLKRRRLFTADIHLLVYRGLLPHYEFQVFLGLHRFDGFHIDDPLPVFAGEPFGFLAAATAQVFSGTIPRTGSFTASMNTLS